MAVDAHTHVPCKREDWPFFFDTCRHNRIDKAITSCLGHTLNWPEFPTPGEIRKANELALDFCKASNGLVEMLAYLNPQHDNCEDELRRCLNHGAIGIKLWVSLIDQNGSFEACFKPLKLAEQFNLPVLIHACNKTEGQLKGELETADVAYLARRFPKVRLIEAHAGGCWQKDIELVRPLENLYVDISGFYPQRTMVEELVRILGSHRVLFGSDLPLRTLESQASKVVMQNISEQDKGFIFDRNARNVYGLKDDSTPSVPYPNEITRTLPIDYGEEHFCFCGKSPFDGSTVGLDELSRQIETIGADRALAAHFDCIFAENTKTANHRFIACAKAFSNIVPLPACNPALPGWKHILESPWSAVLVSPYLNQWDLSSELSKDFFTCCSQKHIAVVVNCILGDHRFRPAHANYRLVSDAEWHDFAKWMPENNYVFQGLAESMIRHFLSTSSFRHKLRFEISRLVDFPHALHDVIHTYGYENLVWGSEFPLRHMAANRWIAEHISIK